MMADGTSWTSMTRQVKGVTVAARSSWGRYRVK